MKGKETHMSSLKAYAKEDWTGLTRRLQKQYAKEDLIMVQVAILAGGLCGRPSKEMLPIAGRILSDIETKVTGLNEGSFRLLAWHCGVLCALHFIEYDRMPGYRALVPIAINDLRKTDNYSGVDWQSVYAGVKRSPAAA
jgi:hypothetical protein